MNPTQQYVEDARLQAEKNQTDTKLGELRFDLEREAIRTQHMKSFTWMGIPILQFPGDLMVMQELIWRVKPTCIVETGIAFGGMSAFYGTISPPETTAVYSVDIEIRLHAHLVPMMCPKVAFLESSSVGVNARDLVKRLLRMRKEDREGSGWTFLVSLDSNHTHDHVLEELRLYAPLVSVGSYIVVFDTGIEFFSDVIEQDRPWGKGNNPWTAVQQFLKEDDRFVVDHVPEIKALVTSAPGGFLRRVK